MAGHTDWRPGWTHALRQEHQTAFYLPQRLWKRDYIKYGVISTDINNIWWRCDAAVLFNVVWFSFKFTSMSLFCSSPWLTTDLFKEAFTFSTTLECNWQQLLSTLYEWECEIHSCASFHISLLCDLMISIMQAFVIAQFHEHPNTSRREAKKLCNPSNGCCLKLQLTLIAMRNLWYPPKQCLKFLK